MFPTKERIGQKNFPRKLVVARTILFTRSQSRVLHAHDKCYRPCSRLDRDCYSVPDSIMNGATPHRYLTSDGIGTFIYHSTSCTDVNDL
jgi:hypothetical protein